MTIERNRFLPIRAALAALAPAALLLSVPVQAKPKLPVLGFYTSWAPPSVRYDKITHLMYAFLTPVGGGGITGSVPGDIISTAHAQGVKVIASIGGANNSTGFPSVAANAGSRTTFANNCKSIVNAGADGVDIDWEFPANAGDSANLTLLLKAIRSAIGPGKTLTMDLAPTDEKGKWVSKSALDVCDFYNVMAFDFTGDWAGSPVGQHSSYQQGVLGIYYWANSRGTAKSKVVMGVPFYGKSFPGGAAVDYKQIMSSNPSLSADADQVGQTWFNGVTTMKKKATYVGQNSYGGVMIWQLGGDAAPGAKSLLDAIEQGVAAPPVVGIAARNGRLSGGDHGLPALYRMGLGDVVPAGSVLRAINGRLAYSASGVYLNATHRK